MGPLAGLPALSLVDVGSLVVDVGVDSLFDTVLPSPSFDALVDSPPSLVGLSWLTALFPLLFLDAKEVSSPSLT